MGGLCVIPKTHLIHDKLTHRIDGFGKDDFVSIPGMNLNVFALCLLYAWCMCAC